MPSYESTRTDSLHDQLGRASITVDEPGSCLRVYDLSTTQPLRHGLPENPRRIEERPGDPLLRSGSILLDGLYAMTMEEVRECSVDAVRDGAFNDGEAVPCGEGGCFETGRLWNYVWTRDTAYAVELGLAAVEPTRSRNSLEFKLSELRGGGGAQIVQDTGSGGSYPVSSDRVSWALGAWAVLAELVGPEREAFAARSYEALQNTLEHDRVVVFDPEDGLYRGEQSFLDWREQSYPEWTAQDVAHIAMSKALSTNLLHLRAMEVASLLAAEAGDEAGAARYGEWAGELREAIRRRLWLPEDGMFSTFVTTGLDPAPARRFDLLGSALAVLLGVADEEQARSILSRYPHYGPGAPVMWPQQQLIPVYHNRGEWPFVTAYWLRAAREADNDAVADRMVAALVRGAALNLSNMENFEARTGAPWLEDGDYSGPVVNSQRQLWSVASFLSMVHQTIFGLEPSPDKLTVRPYVTRGLRNSLFSGTSEIVLNDYRYAGRRVTIVIHLPPAGGQGGSYEVGSIEVDGEPVVGTEIASSLFGDGARIDVFLSAGESREPSAITVRDAADWRQVFAPKTPHISSAERSGDGMRVGLTVDEGERDAVTLAVYRDGERMAGGISGSAEFWDDEDASGGFDVSRCYVVEACFTASGNCSHRSPPRCFWPDGTVQEHGAEGFENVGGKPSTQYGRFHYEAWGDPGDELRLPTFKAERTGPHLVQLVFGNGAGSIPTGITCAVKRVTIEDRATGQVVGQGIAAMPHLGAWDRWAESTHVPATLEEGREYRVVIGDGPGAVNMSVFEHFASYTAGLGGASGEFNRVNVAAVKVLAR